MTKKILIDEAVVKQARGWIEDAAVVLSHTTTTIQGGLGAEAEGVGGCYVKVLKYLRKGNIYKAVVTRVEQQAAEPVAAPSRAALAREVARIAGIMRDCGRYVDTSGNGQRTLQSAAAMLDQAPAQQAAEPVAWCLGDPAEADSSNVFLAHEFTPSGEHENEWTPLCKCTPAPTQQPLTDERLSEIESRILQEGGSYAEVLRAVADEAVHTGSKT